jgi:Xaa-Pro aminopeptidase
MRVIKDEEELALMRRACEISGNAHRRLLDTIRPGMREYHVQAQLEHDFRWEGCTGPAYGTIAAAGDNATVLHYTRNDSELRDGELILVDAGGEYGGYCADITRTWPLGRSFSREQAELYDVVLAAQLAAIDTIRPGSTIEDAHDAAVATLAEGLIAAGLAEGPLQDCLDETRYRPFYMHRTSHWLGMDVHDAGAYRVDDRPRSLEPGVVLTVEPGLYVGPTVANAGAYAGIGIRIEDDVVVTDNGCRVLTAEAPKHRAEIETLRASALSRV